jgi:hypothetical protein
MCDLWVRHQEKTARDFLSAREKAAHEAERHTGPLDLWPSGVVPMPPKPGPGELVPAPVPDAGEDGS